MAGVSKEHIRIVQGAGGPKPCIVGSRIRVKDVVTWHENLAMSAKEIVETYDELTLADVYAALAYYWDHREELDRQWAEAQAWAEEYMRNNPSRIQEMLKQSRSGAGQVSA